MRISAVHEFAKIASVADVYEVYEQGLLRKLAEGEAPAAEAKPSKRARFMQKLRSATAPAEAVEGAAQGTTRVERARATGFSFVHPLLRLQLCGVPQGISIELRCIRRLRHVGVTCTYSTSFPAPTARATRASRTTSRADLPSTRQGRALSA